MKENRKAEIALCWWTLVFASVGFCVLFVWWIIASKALSNGTAWQGLGDITVLYLIMNYFYLRWLRKLYPKPAEDVRS